MLLLKNKAMPVVGLLFFFFFSSLGGHSFLQAFLSFCRQVGGSAGGRYSAICMGRQNFLFFQAFFFSLFIRIFSAWLDASQQYTHVATQGHSWPCYTHTATDMHAHGHMLHVFFQRGW